MIEERIQKPCIEGSVFLTTLLSYEEEDSLGLQVRHRRDGDWDPVLDRHPTSYV